MPENVTDPIGKGTYSPVGDATLTDHDGRTLRFKAGATTVEVTALAKDLFRVGAFPNSRPPSYASEAVFRTEWPEVPARMESVEGGFTLATEEATVHVETSPLRVSFIRPDGETFCADDKSRGMGAYTTPGADVFTKPFGEAVRLNKRRAADERTFGCGQRSGAFEKSNTRQTFYNVDPPEGQLPSYDNLYSSTPFTITLQGGRAHGLFFDNPRHTVFDLGKEDPEVNSYESRGGDIVYYVFTGPSPREVIQSYTELTGRTPMPPLWSLGNQQCRWSYETADEVRRIAKEMRERNIPCDVIYLDIDYMDGYRVFTWDPEAFPEPEKLLSELRESGFEVVAIVDPGVKVDEDYPVYTEGRERGYFVQSAVNTEYHNVVWPGLCAFPDFASEDVRKWWGENHRGMIESGISGIWCDMNEPSLFVPHQSTMPESAVHASGPESVRHGDLHNTYGQLMAKAVREGLLDIQPDKRPFVISRAGYAGLQRHAMQWMGDNSSWWEHLHLSMPQLMNVGLSGVANTGVDIGGFFGDTDGELLARWTEFGVFQPFCRNHSAKGTVSQEPWAFGEPYESVCRAMLSLRMRLLPYLYTLFEESHRTGAPILRPLLYEYPEDERTYNADDEFLFGSSVLVAPITRPGINHRSVYLPEGRWFHYWSGEVLDGGRPVLADAPLGQPPVYLKEGHALPLGPVRMNTKESPDAPLTYMVHASGTADFRAETHLYEDAGDGFAYRDRGEYARRSLTTQAASGELVFNLGEREGAYVPARETVLVEVRGLAGAPAAVEVDGSEADSSFEEGVLRLSLPESAEEKTVRIRLRR
ncbi:Alpha-glucosidase family 31 of glycosyl hydrolase [Rubrobacter radiotolerans]|uniref:Alpha-glucosidase family 31 of glycosyl hydrolase n=1 Tax=Rubrobacter radiotolerans TaxID=42256 RepID=A0A023X4A6_RUBRA|nr:TIM-barrel domain-containing protein [Rubrobacter radiotolerans]AHY47168.1 Alpha-glucosidase family 31 of glycosyl hydrolase [Rubrobacter radiotolerans]MDX5894573.1 glycoside hydrolase family 31 protein [Rubrobacter radiotolerans]SMC06291.1 alpha-glucosidase [Rubrobacter radiotolerans DSM 5868]